MAKYFRSLKDAEFNDFSSNLDTQVTVNTVLWNIPPADATALASQRVVYAPLYAAIINKKNRTGIQVEAHRTGRIVFEDFIENFSKQFIIANPVIADGLKDSLGFTVRDRTPSARPVIADAVFTTLDSAPGQRINFICRTTSDGNRSSMHDDADAIEVRYGVATGPLTTLVEMQQVYISTKSRFFIDLGESAGGKKLSCVLRWRNNANPEKSGPWSEMVFTIIVR